VIFTPLGQLRPWVFKGEAGPIVHQPNGAFRTPDAEQVRAAVLADMGLAHGPAWLFGPEIETGAVRAVLRDYQPNGLSMSAVHPAGRRLPTKVRVLIDFLAETFARDPSLAA